MRKISAILLVLCLSVFLPDLSSADPDSPGCRTKCSDPSDGSKTKVERGLGNILLGWTDIPLSIVKVTCDTKSPLWGLAAGTFEGAGKAFSKTISGISDLVTFPVPDRDGRSVKPSELNRQIR